MKRDYRVGMTRRFKRLALAPALAATALVLLLPASAQSIVRPTPGPPLGGVNATGITFGMPTAQVDQEIAWAHSLDAHSIRVEIPWSTLEPIPGQIEPRALAFTDNLVNQAATAGIKVVALAMWTPCWASSA